MQNPVIATVRLPEGFHADHEYVAPCVSGDVATVRILLDRNYLSQQDLWEMQWIAARYAHLQLFQLTINHEINKVTSVTVLLQVCSTGSRDLVMALNKRDPDALKRSYFHGAPLAAAIGSGCSLDFVEFLIDLGADPNAYSTSLDSVLKLASYPTRREGHPSNIEYLNILLLKGARLEFSGVLYGASNAKNDRIEILKFLLERGANPNTDLPATHHVFSPPLHQAVARVDLEVVTLFLEYGADPYMQNRNGVTAFDKNKSASGREIQAAMESAVLNKSHESRATS